MAPQKNTVVLVSQKLTKLSQDTCVILYLEEQAVIPSEHSHLCLHTKGFFPEVEIQDFPIRGKAVYLCIKRRRWEDPLIVVIETCILRHSHHRRVQSFLKELLR